MNKAAKMALSVIVIGGAGAGIIAYASTRSSSSTAAKKVPVTLSTAQVTQQDLTTYNQTTATLGFTTSATVSSPIDGTVTTIVKTGATIDAGSVVGSIDGAPVVALIGDVPPYRDLALNVTDGADVRQLKENLVALGYDPTGAITINNHYDTATVNAVDAWETALGVTVDGKVPKSRIVYIPGRLLIDTVSVPVGGHVGAGGAMATGRVTQRKFLLPATVAVGSTVANFTAPGTAISSGSVLFEANGYPVVAIEGDPTAQPETYRNLNNGVTDGADVKLLEQFLVADGFDPNHKIVVDDHFDANTTAAVEAWQTKLGIAHPNGVVPAGSILVVPAGLEMGPALVKDGTKVTGEPVVATLTSPARQVSTTAPVGDATFVLGAQIQVLFPDGTVKNGTVTNVGNVATTSSSSAGSTPTVPITIEVSDIPANVASFVQIPVTLQVVQDQTKNALVVPVTALVALAEGGYAVEVVDGKNPDGTFITHLVAATPGLYSSGFVAVTGNIKAGMNVVVPS
jgi:peptidoglycan hydrolase-like protein with peptidoglycan-binding domain